MENFGRLICKENKKPHQINGGAVVVYAISFVPPQKGTSSSMSSKGLLFAGAERAAAFDGAGCEGMLPPNSASPPEDDALCRLPSICISLASISVV